MSQAKNEFEPGFIEGNFDTNQQKTIYYSISPSYEGGDLFLPFPVRIATVQLSTVSALALD
jgi:hypothetical protein